MATFYYSFNVDRRVYTEATLLRAGGAEGANFSSQEVFDLNSFLYWSSRKTGCLLKSKPKHVELSWEFIFCSSLHGGLLITLFLFLLLPRKHTLSFEFLGTVPPKWQTFRENWVVFFRNWELLRSESHLIFNPSTQLPTFQEQSPCFRHAHKLTIIRMRKNDDGYPETKDVPLIFSMYLTGRYHEESLQAPQK